MTRTLLLLFLAISSSVCAQKVTRDQYIERFAPIAVQEMKDYGIPASITLAQGILESGDGNSQLASRGNNHFGIKCHDDWTGKTIKHDDDRRNECFRVYDDPFDSYRDHSLFLTERSRYSELFKLKPTDYKGWARGLKKAGYATDPKYADRLIDLIERHELFRYDTNLDVVVPEPRDSAYFDRNVLVVTYHPNKIKFVRVPLGYTLEQISEETGVSVRRLLKYNELRYDQEVSPGDLLFLQPKKKKAIVKTHRVNKNETMYEISQQYGVQLTKLYERNRMAFGEEPSAGDLILLKGRGK